MKTVLASMCSLDPLAYFMPSLSERRREKNAKRLCKTSTRFRCHGAFFSFVLFIFSTLRESFVCMCVCACHHPFCSESVQIKFFHNIAKHTLCAHYYAASFFCTSFSPTQFISFCFAIFQHYRSATKAIWLLNCVTLSKS